MTKRLDDFVRDVSGSGLLSESDLHAWMNTIPAESRPQDGEELARELIKQRKLTKFQAEQIYAGKGKSLILGNYVILDKLGQGGMGMVLKAEHKRMKRAVAIKVMSGAAMKSPDAVKRFHREVEAAARLSHPNIVAAFDADEDRGTHFLVMEFVAGSDLAQVVKQSGALPFAKALDYTIQAARGLEHAHQQGLVHRDIKPANLLLDQKGTVKILDMGLARLDDSVGGSSVGAGLTTTGTIMGTVDYMSPEQALDTKHADARSDIYCLGISLHFFLTGRVAYPGDTIMKKLLAHREDAIPSLRAVLPDVTPELDAVFQKMIAKKPADRYQTMPEVIAALQACTAGGIGRPSETVSLPASSSPADTVGDSQFRNFLQGLPDRTSDGRTIEKNDTLIPPPSKRSPATATEAIPVKRRKPVRGPKPAAGTASRKLVVIGIGSVALVMAVLVLFWQPGRARGKRNQQLPDHREALQNDKLQTIETSVVSENPSSSTVDFVLEFDGKASYVEIPTLERNKPEPLTIEAWVRPKSVSTRVIVRIEGKAPVQAYMDSISVLSGLEMDSSNATIRAVKGVSRQSADAMIHLAYVIDDRAAKLFVNGVCDDTKRGSFATPFSQAPFQGSWLGAQKSTQGGMDYFFAGVMDEVRISKVARYDKDFTPDVRFTSDKDTLALYHFDEGTGSELKDSSGNNHHGKIVGAKWVKSDRESEISNFKSQMAESRSPYDILTSPDYEWSAPENLGPTINTPSTDAGPAISGDGLTLVYFSARPGLGNYDLFIADRKSRDEPFGSPQNLGPTINSAENESNAWLSSDGLTLMFASDRTSAKKNYDLFLSTRPSRAVSFGPAAPIAELNTSSHESGGVLSSDGRTIFYNSNRGGGSDPNVWQATRPDRSARFGEPTPLAAPVESPLNDSVSWLSVDDRVLFFTRRSKDFNVNDSEIWMATRPSATAPFAEPKLVGPPISQPDTPDGQASITADGQLMFFASQRSGGLGSFDIWQSRRVLKPTAIAIYPQPAIWIDVTAELRRQALGNGIVADGEWLHWPASATGGAKMFNLTPGQQIRNALVRVRYSGRVDIALRRKTPRTGNDDLRYEAGISPTTAAITFVRPAGSDLLAPHKQLGPLFRPDEEHEVVFAAQGDTLTIWIDGQNAVTAQNNTLSSGEIAIGMINSAKYGNCRIKKVEYGELPDVSPTAASIDKPFVNTLGMEFVRVPKGKSWLGGGSGKPGTQEVTIPDDFYLGKFEVTQDEWLKVMGNNPSSFQRTGSSKDLVKEISEAQLLKFPVDNVTWAECQDYLKQLNAKVTDTGWVYRLPTVSEWEYACRGGPLTDPADSAFDFYFDRPTNSLLSELANCSVDHKKLLNRTSKVGSYPPNRLGLFDMHGNVWERCDDQVTNERGESLRPVKGGAFISIADFCRAAHQSNYPPSVRHVISGFGLRVARVPVKIIR